MTPDYRIVECAVGDAAACLDWMIQRSGLSQKAAATKLGISPQYLCDVLGRRRRVTPELASAAVEQIEKGDKIAALRRLHRLGAEQDGWKVEMPDIYLALSECCLRLISLQERVRSHEDDETEDERMAWSQANGAIDMARDALDKADGKPPRKPAQHLVEDDDVAF